MTRTVFFLKAHMVSVVFWATLSLCVVERPVGAGFSIEPETGMIRGLDFAVTQGRTYIVYEHAVTLSWHGSQLRLDIRDRPTGERISDINLSSAIQEAVPSIAEDMRLGVNIVDVGQGSILVLGGKESYAFHLNEDGTVNRHVWLGTELGGLVGVDRSGDVVVAVFRHGIAVVDGDLEIVDEWVTDREIEAFGIERGSVWLLDTDFRTPQATGFDGATVGGFDVALRGFRVDGGLVRMVAVPIDVPLGRGGSFGGVVAWADEVVVFTGDEGTLWRCVYGLESSEMQCVDSGLVGGTRPVDHGIVFLQVRKAGMDNYLLAYPDDCGMWMRKFDREHSLTTTQPATRNAAGVTDFLMRGDADNGYVSVSTQFFRRGSRSAGSRVMFRPFGEESLHESIEATPVWFNKCPAWNDFDFFVDASPADTLRCIEAGADPNGPGLCGDGLTSPLAMAAALSSDPEVVRTLVVHGADAKTVFRSGSTVLHHAVLTLRNREILDVLISAGADVNATDAYGMTALHHLALYGRDRTTFDALIDAGGDLELKDNEGYGPLIYATSNAALQDHPAVKHAQMATVPEERAVD